MINWILLTFNIFWKKYCVNRVVSLFPTGILRVYPLCGVAPGLFPGCVRGGGGPLHPLLQEHLPASRPRLQCRIHGLFPHQGTLYFWTNILKFNLQRAQFSLNLISKQNWANEQSMRRNKTLRQFVAATDKLHFMFEIGSFVDYFTIPPMFVSIFLDRTWIGWSTILYLLSFILFVGLRFLRVLRLMSIPDILQYLNVLKLSTSIRWANKMFGNCQQGKKAQTNDSTKTLSDWPSSLLCSSQCGWPLLELVRKGEFHPTN